MRETAAPRAKEMVLQAGKSDKLFYLCTLCGACKVACPLSIDVDKDVVNARAALVEAGSEIGSNKRMIENLRKYGNPFGEGKENPFGESEDVSDQ